MSAAWALRDEPRAIVPSDLPAGAPLAARCLCAALAWCPPDVIGDVRGGSENSRRARRALAQAAALHGLPALSRAEVRRGAAYLRELHATRGGVL